MFLYRDLAEDNDGLEGVVEENVSTQGASDVLALMQGDDPGLSSTDTLRQLVVDGFLLGSNSSFLSGKAALENLLPPGSAYKLELLNGDDGNLTIIDKGARGGIPMLATAYVLLPASWDTNDASPPASNQRFTPGEDQIANNDQLVNKCTESPAGTAMAGDGRYWYQIWRTNPLDPNTPSSDYYTPFVPYGVWVQHNKDCGAGGTVPTTGQAKDTWVEDRSNALPQNHVYTVRLKVWP